MPLVDSLAGHLLVATPALTDDPFHRSVIQILHHDEEGAHGVILNRPTHADVEVILPAWAPISTSPDVVFQGGPVGLDTALGLVSLPGDGPEPGGVRRLFGSLALVDLGRAEEAVPVLLDALLAQATDEDSLRYQPVVAACTDDLRSGRRPSR